jgi:DNA repair exonuclease SbcCD ATPase subunit
MELAPTSHDRIFSAADTLYEQAGRQTFPTVDAVRKFARVNMNDASTGMKAWRRAQATQIISMTVRVPDTLQQSNAAALTALWSEAVSVANETLRAAQAGWDVERAEAEALREQMANAYETQVTELEVTQSELEKLQSQLAQANTTVATLRQRSDDMQHEMTAVQIAAKQAEALTIEIERRAADLRAELDYAHATIASAAEESAAQHSAHVDEIAGLRGDLAQLRKKAEHLEVAEARVVEIERRAADLRAELDRAHATIASAAEESTAQYAVHVEEIAGLRGELAQLQQKAELQEMVVRSELTQAREEAATLRGKFDALTEPKAPIASKARSRKKPDGEAAK